MIRQFPPLTPPGKNIQLEKDEREEDELEWVHHSAMEMAALLSDADT